MEAVVAAQVQAQSPVNTQGAMNVQGAAKGAQGTQGAQGAQGAQGQNDAAQGEGGGMFAALLQQMLGTDGETAILGAGPQQKAMLVEQMRQQLAQDGAEMGMQLLAELLAVNPLVMQQMGTAELAELMQTGTQQTGLGAVQAMQQNPQQMLAGLMGTQAAAVQTPETAQLLAQTLLAGLPTTAAGTAQTGVPNGSQLAAELIQQTTAQGQTVQAGAASGEAQQSLTGESQFTRALFTAQQSMAKGGTDAAEVLAEVSGEKPQDKTKQPDNVIAFPQQAKLEQLGKMSELAKLENVDAKELLQQIKTGVADGAAAGKNEFLIKLKPDGLGEITVRMLEEAGKITLRMTASSPQTQRLLNGELAALREAVRPYNVEVQNVESQNTQHFDLQQQKQGFTQQQQQQQQASRQNHMPSYESYEQLEAEPEQEPLRYVGMGLNTVV